MHQLSYNCPRRGDLERRDKYIHTRGASTANLAVERFGPEEETYYGDLCAWWSVSALSYLSLFFFFFFGFFFFFFWLFLP